LPIVWYNAASSKGGEARREARVDDEDEDENEDD
jgi:hypothetical protein